MAGWQGLPRLWLQTLDRDSGRDMGKRRARPGLYQCSSGDCRFQFTVTTHAPLLHATKPPLRVWLKAMWLLPQSDKSLSVAGQAGLELAQSGSWLKKPHTSYELAIRLRELQD
jgi:hypothetical protein